jgi:endonuclease/exonuclease/phosphatase (EEP) superfamily protein YafD
MLKHLPHSSLARGRQLGYLLKGPKGPLDALDAVWKLSVGETDMPIEIGKSLQFLVWNIQKNKKRSVDALEHMWNTFDINVAMIQELQLNQAMEKEKCAMFEDRHATLVTNIFMHKNERGPSGVCTISEAKPTTIIPLLPRPKEPFGVSKPGLGQLYEIKRHSEKLGVWNLHAINFVNIREYQLYLTAAFEEIVKHKGPKIVAGDFNSWSKRREECTRLFCEVCDLEEILFEGPVKKFRGYRLDRVMVSKKGLHITNAHALNYRKHSDHNPLLFKLEVLVP